MTDSNVNIGQEENLAKFQDAFDRLKHEQKGSIICLSGETGMGKSFLMQRLTEKLQKESVPTVYVNSQAPIGNFNIGNIQPLLPFSRTVEKLLSRDYLSAKKKFYKSAGITMLASIPITGDIFYAVKELDRDWREYKKDKSSRKTKALNEAVQDYFDTISTFIEKMPLVLFLDDMQWTDHQSVELLSYFADQIEDMPLIICVAYRKSLLESIGSPMIPFVDEKTKKFDHVSEIVLEPFSQEQIDVCAKQNLENYHHSEAFLNWMQRHTIGTPGVVAEYMKYFMEYSPFDSEGNFKEDISTSEFLPTSVHTAFSKVLDKLSEEERNTLSVCSAEGREFTATIVSSLLNTDILQTIRKLRHLQQTTQQTTQVIRSVGASLRYGVKTTVYQFTQAFYYNYFENSLEYEENQALHSEIAALLKQRYNDAESEAVRKEIAPYLAAHSVESGDKDTAKAMLLVAAKNAKEYGSSEIAEGAYERFRMLSDDDEEDRQLDAEEIAFQNILSGGNGTGDGSSEVETDEDSKSFKEAYGNTYIDFKNIRRAIVEDYHKKNFSASALRAVSFFESKDMEFRSDEKAQLLALAIKAYVELGDYIKANKYSDIALKLVKTTKEPVSECLVLNSAALLSHSQKNKGTALIYLQQAAEKAIKLPEEIRLLTMANIALLTGNMETETAKPYYLAVLKLCSKYEFKDLEREVFQR